MNFMQDVALDKHARSALVTTCKTLSFLRMVNHTKRKHLKLMTTLLTAFSRPLFSEVSKYYVNKYLD